MTSEKSLCFLFQIFSVPSKLCFWKWTSASFNSLDLLNLLWLFSFFFTLTSSLVLPFYGHYGFGQLKWFSIYVALRKRSHIYSIDISFSTVSTAKCVSMLTLRRLIYASKATLILLPACAFPYIIFMLSTDEIKSSMRNKFTAVTFIQF